MNNESGHFEPKLNPAQFYLGEFWAKELNEQKAVRGKLSREPSVA